MRNTNHGGNGTDIAAGLNSKFKDYEFAATPILPNGSIGNGYLPGEELLGGGILKGAASGLIIRKVMAKGVLAKARGTSAGRVIMRPIVKEAPKALPHQKAIKKIVRNASKPGVTLSDKKIDQLKRVVNRSGGKVRTEVGTTKNIKGVKHSQVEGYGGKTKSRHIIHKNQQ